jgi:ATP-binding cassette subfamily B protein
MRFYDPTEGTIRLDGIDIQDYRVDDLREQFSVVLQDSVLFSTSIAENIAYARPDADLSEIEEAARAANAHHFIQLMPNGYETHVGDRGIKLSGGERQRIALARAFLRDSPILILDEPTSAVDYQTEALIMESLQRLIAGRTTFLITHRTSLLELCQVVLKVEREGTSLETILSQTK